MTNMNKYIDTDKLIARLRKHLMPTILDRDYDEWEMGKDAGLRQAIGIVESCQKLSSPQSNWKPSKEQMKALNAVANEGVLLDLFNDLLKLF